MRSQSPNKRKQQSIRNSLRKAREFGLYIPLSMWERDKWKNMPPFPIPQEK